MWLINMERIKVLEFQMIHVYFPCSVVLPGNRILMFGGTVSDTNIMLLLTPTACTHLVQLP